MQRYATSMQLTLTVHNAATMTWTRQIICLTAKYQNKYEDYKDVVLLETHMYKNTST